jgi:hypothetical protein
MYQIARATSLEGLSQPITLVHVVVAEQKTLEVKLSGFATIVLCPRVIASRIPVDHCTPTNSA